jgi:hypothetical protein
MLGKYGKLQRKSSSTLVAPCQIEQLERRLQLTAVPTLQLASDQVVTAGSPIQLPDGDTAFNREGSIAVNPINPLEVVGAMMHDYYSYVLFYYSKDGGKTWSSVNITDAIDHYGTGARQDPFLTFADNGDLWIYYRYSGSGTAAFMNKTQYWWGNLDFSTGSDAIDADDFFLIDTAYGHEGSILL